MGGDAPPANREEELAKSKQEFKAYILGHRNNRFGHTPCLVSLASSSGSASAPPSFFGSLPASFLGGMA